MRRRFWKWVHAKLEQAWHWVYYHKLAEPPLAPRGDIRYSVEFLGGSRGGGKTQKLQEEMLVDPRPYKIYGSAPGGALHEIMDTKADTKQIHTRKSFIPKRDRW